MPEITLYIYWGSPQCRAVLMTAKLLGLQPNVLEVDMMKNYHKHPEFKQINPDQTLPALTDGKTRVSQSREIMKYLCDGYGGSSYKGNKPSIYPKTKIRSLVTAYLEYDAKAVAPIVHKYAVDVSRNRLPDQEVENDVKDILADLDGKLKGKKYVAGNHVSIADISLRFSIDMLLVLDYDLNPYEHVKAWTESMTDVPFFRQIQHEFKEWMHRVETTPRSCCTCWDELD
ncbi:glutathione S-transferase 1-like [Lineus longissimus]|uniref:glutathione S-transferase 1-like n=1 Tax=Lineus longissimus TaxID=88925 RepID=UPI002B4FA9E4